MTDIDKLWPLIAVGAIILLVAIVIKIWGPGRDDRTYDDDPQN